MGTEAEARRLEVPLVKPPPDQPGVGGGKGRGALSLRNQLLTLLRLTPVSTENDPMKFWGSGEEVLASARTGPGHGAGGCTQLKPA